MAATSGLQPLPPYRDIITVRPEQARPPFRREWLCSAYRARRGPYLNFEGSAPAIWGEFEKNRLCESLRLNP
jgi:hypothetical protein